MHSQVLLVVERSKDGVGDTAVADLDGVAVFDDPGNVRADFAGDLRVNLARAIFQQRLVMGNQVIDLINMNKAVAVNAGHMPVHLRHHQVCALQRRLDDINAHAEAEIAAGIGRRGLD